jgi:hypothetical protein
MRHAAEVAFQSGPSDSRLKSSVQAWLITGPASSRRAFGLAEPAELASARLLPLPSPRFAAFDFFGTPASR